MYDALMFVECVWRRMIPIYAFNTDICILLLPEDCHFHTMDGDLLCGGKYSTEYPYYAISCLCYGLEGWSKSNWNLQQYRFGAVSWQLPIYGEGLQIMGGIGGMRTSEIVNSACSQKGFDLEYKT